MLDVVAGDVVVTGAVAQLGAVEQAGSALGQTAARWSPRMAMMPVPLQLAAVVDVVRVVDAVDVDVVEAATTATAHPAGSLTGMMALAGAMRMRSVVVVAAATGEQQTAVLRLRQRRRHSSRSQLRRLLPERSLQPVRRLQQLRSPPLRRPRR